MNPDSYIVEIKDPLLFEDPTRKWVLQQALKMNLNLHAIQCIMEENKSMEKFSSNDAYFSYIIDQYNLKFLKNSEMAIQEAQKLPKLNNIRKQFSSERTHSILLRGNSKKQTEMLDNANFNNLQSAQKCKVCLEQKKKEEFHQVHCGHTFCKSCLNDYLQINISSAQLQIRCPEEGCNSEFSPKEIEDLVGSCCEESAKLIEKYHRFIKYAEINSDPNSRWCINPKCETWLKGTADQPKLTCPNCNQSMCFNCLSKYRYLI